MTPVRPEDVERVIAPLWVAAGLKSEGEQMKPEDEARRLLTLRKQVTNRQEAHEHAEAHAREAEALLVRQHEEPSPERTGMAAAHGLLAIYFQREAEAL